MSSFANPNLTGPISTGPTSEGPLAKLRQRIVAVWSAAVSALKNGTKPSDRDAENEDNRSFELEMALHDLKNLLMAASSYVERAQRLLKDSAAQDRAREGQRVSDASASLERASSGLTRCIQITNGAGKLTGTQLREHFDITEPLKLAIELLPPGLTNGVEISINDHPQGVGFVNANFLDAYRVFANLLINACQALAERSAEDRAINPSKIAVILAVERGTTVSVRVVDNGRGVPPERRASLLNECGYTTKKSVGGGIGGQGLGLYGSKLAMQRLGGTLVLEEPKPGASGASFLAQFPLAAA